MVQRIMNKKTVLIHSNFCKAFTGFGKNKKNILRYLFKTGKYNLVEVANGKPWSDLETHKMPWTCVGSLPDQQTLAKLTDPNEQRAAAYGAYGMDSIVQHFKPDVYIGIEDIWAFDGMINKPWWSKVNTMVWTTLDSLPILQSAIDAAPKIKHYYVWASFAEKALNKLGYDHVKTLRGSLDVSSFYRFEDEKRNALREKFGLQDSWVVGFVFRNQLRKSVPNILEGFKQFKKQVPEAKLLLHTHWSEGWNIPALIEEKEINPSDILTTYFCSKCKQYEIRPFTGQEQTCGHCGSQKTLNTTNIAQGVNETQLNEIYNLFDVYCHPFTSGGQEIPIQEAKLAELVTLVTSYSCGEDYCTGESGGFPLNWAEYREPGTQFIKASTCPKSIEDQLLHVYNLSPDERKTLGTVARQFVIDTCSIEVIGKQLEDIIDSMPHVEWDFEGVERALDGSYEPDFEMDDASFVIDIHDKMLCEVVDHNHTSVKHWLSALSGGMTKQDLMNHFRSICSQKSQKPIEFGDMLDADDKGKRIAVVIPQSETDVLMINALAKNLKKLYPQHNIYVLTPPQYFEYIEDNPFIHKCIPYADSINNPFILEGIGNHEGYFDMAFFPTFSSQTNFSYIHNGKDKTQFQLQ